MSDTWKKSWDMKVLVLVAIVAGFRYVPGIEDQGVRWQLMGMVWGAVMGLVLDPHIRREFGFPVLVRFLAEKFAPTPPVIELRVA